jgi:hypothetical protein
MEKFSKNLFLWDGANESSIQKRFMKRVTLFLSKTNNLKHSIKEFFAMIPWSAAVECQYITRFKELFPSAIRSPDRAFGDMTVTLGNININIELKLVALDSLRYTAKLFRPRHSLEVCVNSASVFACVVLNSQETSKARRASDPQVCK